MKGTSVGVVEHAHAYHPSLKGLTHPLKGLTHPLKGLTHLLKGLTHPLKGLTHALKGPRIHSRVSRIHSRAHASTQGSHASTQGPKNTPRSDSCSEGPRIIHHVGWQVQRTRCGVVRKGKGRRARARGDVGAKNSSDDVVEFSARATGTVRIRVSVHQGIYIRAGGVVHSRGD